MNLNFSIFEYPHRFMPEVLIKSVQKSFLKGPFELGPILFLLKYWLFDRYLQFSSLGYVPTRSNYKVRSFHVRQVRFIFHRIVLGIVYIYPFPHHDNSSLFVQVHHIPYLMQVPTDIQRNGKIYYLKGCLNLFSGNLIT